ncbi:hypothetical protein LTR33_017373, partial [Friedmanniomyces endolithicus]
ARTHRQTADLSQNLQCLLPGHHKHSRRHALRLRHQLHERHRRHPAIPRLLRKSGRLIPRRHRLCAGRWIHHRVSHRGTHLGPDREERRLHVRLFVVARGHFCAGRDDQRGHADCGPHAQWGVCGHHIVAGTGLSCGDCEEEYAGVDFGHSAIGYRGRDSDYVLH